MLQAGLAAAAAAAVVLAVVLAVAVRAAFPTLASSPTVIWTTTPVRMAVWMTAHWGTTPTPCGVKTMTITARHWVLQAEGGLLLAG